MPRLSVMLLGGFEARLASGAPVSLPTKKAQALLAYLGIRPGQSHPRDKLAALLWGEKSDEKGRGGLRHALVALRRALAGADPTPLRIEGQTLALDPDGVEVDAGSFERWVAEGTPQALTQAAELYRGDLLMGFTVNEPLLEASYVKVDPQGALGPGSDRPIGASGTPSMIPTLCELAPGWELTTVGADPLRRGLTGLLALAAST